MYKKLTIIITAISAVIFYYLNNKFYNVSDYKFAYLKDFVPYYEAAAKQFTNVGFAICIAVLICINITVIKTQKLAWLWIPFLFGVLYSLIITQQSEHIFKLNKKIEETKGSFSLGFLIGIIGIIISTFAITINYLILKIFISRTKRKALSDGNLKMN